MVAPIAVLVGQAGTAFKVFGGPSLVLKLLSQRIFGTTIRTIEYPNGELHTIRLFVPTLTRLRGLIAQVQPEVYPTAYVSGDDVKQMSIFHSPHFTEKVESDADVRKISSNAWLFWSKELYEDDPIPLKGVKLDGSHIEAERRRRREESLVSDRELQDRAIAIAKTLSKRRRYGLSHFYYDKIVDLAVDGDPGLLTLTRNFGSDQREFQRQVLRLIERRDSLSLSDSSVSLEQESCGG